MIKQNLAVFYFIKNTQKATVMRKTVSNDKTYYYVQVQLPHITYFARVSKSEYNQLNDHWSVVKDSFVTYQKGDKTYHESCLRFK